MLPVLRRCAERPWSMQDLIARISDDFSLTDVERSEQTPSGSALVIASRVHWAKTYLKQARLVEPPKRSVFEMTKRGQDLLATSPERIDNSMLRKFPDFLEFLARTKQPRPRSTPPPNGPKPQDAGTPILPFIPASSTPDEQIDQAVSTLTEALRDALLARILESPPAFF